MPLESFQGATACHWANFSAVLFPFELLKEAMAFWRDTGSGLSTRHAEFCLDELDYLDCDSENPEFRKPAPLKRDYRGIPQTLACIQNAASRAPELRSILAKLATSDRPNEPDVHPDDVFLYPSGMNAMFSLSDSLSSITPNSNVAAFGYDSSMFTPTIVY
jgi:cystathionine gamma-synthase